MDVNNSIWRSNLRLSLSPPASLVYSDHLSYSSMEEKDFNELNDETRAREVKRTYDIKIAEVSTSKKKRAKKAPAETPEHAQVQVIFDDQEKQSEERAKRYRLYRV